MLLVTYCVYSLLGAINVYIMVAAQDVITTSDLETTEFQISSTPVSSLVPPAKLKRQTPALTCIIASYVGTKYEAKESRACAKPEHICVYIVMDKKQVEEMRKSSPEAINTLLPPNKEADETLKFFTVANCIASQEECDKKVTEGKYTSCKTCKENDCNTGEFGGVTGSDALGATVAVATTPAATPAAEVVSTVAPSGASRGCFLPALLLCSSAGIASLWHASP